MTLEELRKDHPELVAAIETAAREGYVLKTDSDAAVEAAKAEATKTALESAEVKNGSAALAAIVEALRPIVPELKVEADKVEQTAVEKALEEVQAKLVAVTAKLEAEQNARATAEAERVKAEAATARKTLIDGLLEKYEHAELVRPKLEALDSEDAIRAAFDENKSLIESVMTRKKVTESGSPAGSGRVESNGDELNESLDEVKAAQKALI